MTTEATGQRALLEGKARDELVQIAAAAGVKIPARARKAVIVDAILGPVEVPEAPAPAAAAPSQTAPPETAAGSAAASAAASERVDPKPSGPRVRRVRLGEEDAIAAPTSDSDASRTPRPGSGAEPDRSGVNRSRAKGGDAPREQNNSRRSSAESNTSDKRGTDGNGSDRNSSDRNSPDRNGAAKNSVEQNGPDKSGNDKSGSDKQSDESVESGNRRRRRRGRGGEDEQWQGDPVQCSGILDLRDEGYGFLRTRGLLPSTDDVYVAAKQVRQFGLRRGDQLQGTSRPASRNEKNPAMLTITSVNSVDPELSRERPHFEELTALYPDEPLKLELSWNKANLTARVVDILAPIGKGQRGLIVSPPKAGKTTVIKSIAKSIEENNPEVELMMLLIDERPEEVTDIRRSIKGEVVASTFDRPAEEHIQIAELTIERAKRAVESGKDVVVILDGITRLARAYNLAAPGTGRVMSGGVDSAALYPPKRFFGAARNVEEGGSLTILATALVETGSKMDEVIFEEFKGTGNMELRLDRRLAERRIFPAIDIAGSSTRHEELLMTPRQLDQVWKLRKVLTGIADGDGTSAGIPNGAGLELLLDRLGNFKTNGEFLEELSKAP